MRRRLLNVCFHGIGTPGRDLEPGEAAYWITTDQFHRYLDRLVGRPEVRISFDDGNASDAEIGLPALRERGLRAIFFVLAGRLDRPGSLASEQVRELVGVGMSVGTHGMDHRPWRGLDPVSRVRELETAREQIASVAGTEVREAALPLGRYDRTLLRELRRLGYAAVHTSDRRWAWEGAWVQPRYSARAEDTAESLERDVLTPPPLHRTLLGEAKGLVKRLR